jgi:hypothetical protein
MLIEGIIEKLALEVVTEAKPNIKGVNDLFVANHIVEKILNNYSLDAQDSEEHTKSLLQYNLKCLLKELH